MGQWDYSVEPPEWLTEAARVEHTTFGRGTVGRVGRYKNVPTVWIDFDRRFTKALSIEYGLPHLSPEQPKLQGRPWFRRSRRP